MLRIPTPITRSQFVAMLSEYLFEEVSQYSFEQLRDDPISIVGTYEVTDQEDNKLWSNTVFIKFHTDLTKDMDELSMEGWIISYVRKVVNEEADRLSGEILS